MHIEANPDELLDQTEIRSRVMLTRAALAILIDDVVYDLAGYSSIERVHTLLYTLLNDNPFPTKDLQFATKLATRLEQIYHMCGQPIHPYTAGEVLELACYYNTYMGGVVPNLRLLRLLVTLLDEIVKYTSGAYIAPGERAPLPMPIPAPGSEAPPVVQPLVP
jgi:hypothetical protein